MTYKACLHQPFALGVFEDPSAEKAPEQRRTTTKMNRSRSLRSKNHASAYQSGGSTKKFSFASLRGDIRKSDMSTAMYKLIKTENNVINAYEAAARGIQSMIV